MLVDPTGLGAAAQRIMSALAQLPSADAVHPTLAADPASQGAALRLSSGAAALAALLAELAAGLTATADVLGAVAVGFGGTEQANAANLSNLGGVAASPTVTGFAPPAVWGPDVRPPLPPPAPMLGEGVSRAAHAGDPGAGEAFVSGWTSVADAVDAAAAVVAQVVDALPDTWNSPLSTPVVRNHLLGYHMALSQSGRRARGLARQANRHADDLIQARQDIPDPRRFDELNEQIRQTWKANLDTGGKYAPALAALNARKVALNDQALLGYANYHGTTDITTAPDPAAADAPGATAESAGQPAGLMSTMLPAALGAVGGLAGGVLSTVTKVPEALAQAVTQAAGAAMQGLSGAMGSPPDTTAGAADPRAADPAADASGAGSPETTPASGVDTPTPSVRPSTGAAPTPPTVPPGALSGPAQGASGPGATMPMGMPMGAMTPGGATGGGKQKDQRAKHLVVPRTPHTESVTGKVSEDRIARSASAPSPPDPPHDPPPGGQRPQPIVRRITMTPPTDDPS
jgi:hypothetical protein